MVAAGTDLPASILSADDVPELVAEVMDLRFAVAARPMVGEVLTLREAVRTEVISMCAEYAATLDAVRALHSPESHGGMYCTYETGDRPECQECYPEGEDTGPGHTRLVCKECRVDDTWLNGHNRMEWPCATAKLLEPSGEAR